jgi:phospholipase D1/2
VFRSLELSQRTTLEGMRALVDAHPPYGPLLFMGVCIAGIFLHMPLIVLIALGGMLFEALPAFAYGWIACVMGTTGTFVVVRYVARDRFQRILEHRFARLRALDQRLERHGFRTVFLLRLVLFLAPPLNWVLGATRVRTSQYVAATALGIVPGMALTVFFADSIASGGQGGPQAPRVALAAAVLLVFLASAAVLTRRLLGKPGDAT